MKHTGAKELLNKNLEKIMEMHNAGTSQASIARDFGCSQAMVYRFYRENGIKAHPKHRSGPQNGRFKDGSQARGYRKLVVKTECAKCGRKDTLGIHHKNDDHFDNRAENLEVLCNSCHISLTKKKWWDAKKAGLPLPKSNAPLGWTKRDHARWVEKQKANSK